MSAIVTDVAKARAAVSDVAKSRAAFRPGKEKECAGFRRSAANAAALVLDVAGVERPDVLLVRPWARSAVPEDALVDDALGVGYLASALRAGGFSVALLDAFTFGFRHDQVVACAAAIAPRVLGVSLHSFADYEPAVAIADGVRALCPDVPIVAGGEHATFLARPLLERHRSLDAIVIGEGERTVVDLVGAWLGGEAHAVVAGAMTRDPEGAVADGGTRPAVADLDSLPPPAKDVVEIARRLGRPAAVSLLSGRGCTHRCTFCTAHTYLRLGGGAVWRRRSPRAVADELAEIARRFEARPGFDPMVQFQDVVFLGTSRAARAWARDFAGELERRELRAPFYVMARAEAVLANADVLPRLARAGLASIEIGIESGVDRILEAYGKQSSASEALRAVEALRALGIAYDASGFIMFDPRMALEDVLTNVSFLEELDHFTWDRAITRLQVFPGTVIREQLRGEGLLVASRGLGDVYDYRFADARVGATLAWVAGYDEPVRRLDALVRADRKAGAGGGLAAGARTLYGAWFRGLVAFAADEAPSSVVEAARRDFLADASTMLRTSSVRSAAPVRRR
jgi:radical SAM superfamily enzyme YgiQ (UPF0313 family)